MHCMDESVVWIRDKDGRELACVIDDIKTSKGWDINPDEIEKDRCVDVSRLIGTKRW